MKDDKDKIVRKTVELLLPYVKADEIIDDIKLPQNHLLIQMLVKSVSSNDFVSRFEDEVFMM